MARLRYKLQVNANTDQQKNRKSLINLFRSSPLPEEHLMVNLGLYQRSSTVAKLLYLNEIYQKIIPIPGVVMEFGTWYGQTLVQFLNLRAVYEPYNYTRKIIGFDTFTGYQGLSRSDGDHHLMKRGQYTVPKSYIAYLTSLLNYHENENTMSHIKKYELVKGNATATVKAYIRKNPQLVIALAYFDMQVYKPTKAGLRAIMPRLVKGSVIAMDELNASEFPGETLAFREEVGLSKYPLYRSKYLPDRSYTIIT